MQRIASLLLTALLGVAFLAGCTGTQEERLPTILIIGSAPAGGPQLQLVEDVFDPTATPARDLAPLPASERALPAPPVSMDLTDRDGSRSELVVLAVEDDGSEAFLITFDVAEIDPENLGATFVETNVLDLGPVFAGTPIAGDLSCLVDVQVTSDGRFAALLDDGTCVAGGNVDIHLVDIASADLEVTLGEEFVLRDPPIAVGIHVDQDEDVLWYAADSITETSLYSVDLPPTSAPRDGASVDLNPETVEDHGFAPILNGFALLANGELALVAPPSTDASAMVDTLTGATLVMPDPSGALEQFVVLDADTAALHEDLEDDDPADFQLESTLVDITLEPVQQFAYVLEEDGVEIFDVFDYADQPSGRLEFREIPGLDEPRVITWVFAGGVENSLP